MDGGGHQSPPGANCLEHISQIEARSRVTVIARLRRIDRMKLQKQSAAVAIVVGVESVGFESIREVFMRGRGRGTFARIGKVPHFAQVAGRGPLVGRGRKVAGGACRSLEFLEKPRGV